MKVKLMMFCALLLSLGQVAFGQKIAISSFPAGASVTRGITGVQVQALQVGSVTQQ
jgi:hypothetical protein